MNTVISCREVGQVCTGLIEDGYALKGFRVDTKSCNWGPMAGFVCMDPRLNKSVYEKEAFNRQMTEEALSGAIHKTGGTDGADLRTLSAEWKANYHPLVISRQRIDQLVALNAIGPLTPDPGDVNQSIGTPGFVGTSAKGGLQITWRLIRLRAGFFEGATTNHFGIFVEANKDFSPEYLGGAKPLVTQVRLSHGRYAPYHALYGLTNPIVRGRNTRFKDCVTGDYDLFGVWPRAQREGLAPVARPSARELQIAAARLKMPKNGPGAGVPTPADRNWDVRPQDKWKREEEHYQLGNISRRVNLIKVILNTELQADPGAIGAKSQLVHHSDEVGNPDALLAKPLLDCLPIIAFVPGEQEAYAIETMVDLRGFVGMLRGGGFTPHLKPDWRADLDD
jgi:hypothetical protein